MELLDTIKNHIAHLNEKTFIAYLGGFILGILLIISGLFYYYYSAVDDLMSQIHDLNTKRSEMRALFAREALVKQQEITVNKILKEDKDFYITEYFQKAADKLKLTPADLNHSETTQADGKYREDTVSTWFREIDMKQVCEFLEEIEDNKRVYTKSLDILRSATAPTKLDVNLVIGTLLTEIPST